MIGANFGYVGAFHMITLNIVEVYISSPLFTAKKTCISRERYDILCAQFGDMLGISERRWARWLVCVMYVARNRWLATG